MSATKPYAATISKWLRDNGWGLGALTGQDLPALKATVHVVELWCFSDSDGRAHAAAAFGHIVRAMQPSCRVLAYHAIAHVGDWSHRNQLWQQAGLEPLQELGRCTYE